MSKKKSTSKKTSSKKVSQDSTVHTETESIVEDSSFANKGWIIFVAFVLVLALIIGGFFGYQKYQEAKQFEEVDFYYLYTQAQNGFETENNFKYGNFIFVNMSGFWQTILVETRQYENYTEQREVFLSSHYNPIEVEDVPIDAPSVLLVRNATVIYMTYPSNLSQEYVLAGVEVGKVIGTKNGILNKPVVQSVYGNYSGDRQIIDCMNATKERVVIKFLDGNQTKVESKDNCVLVQGETPEDVVRSADRLLFTLLGVMAP